MSAPRRGAAPCRGATPRSGAAPRHLAGLDAGDIGAFSDLWTATATVLGGTRPAPEVAAQLFADLARFTLEEIATALTAHRQRSTWIPRPADVVRLLEGELPATAVLVEVAHAHRCPLAVAVRAILKGDLQRLDPRRLEARLGARADELADFHARATLGQYTEEEIARMLNADVDPLGPIGPTMPAPRAPYTEPLAKRVRAVRERKRLASDGASASSRAASVAARDAALRQ